MWIIRDAETQEEVGLIEEVMKDNGDNVLRASIFGRTKEFPAPPFEKTRAFMAAQTWVEAAVMAQPSESRYSCHGG
tara:strand:- start:186 stop:413 length:228 start_codon:yes stop_codon:yes gene_type:complete